MLNNYFNGSPYQFLSAMLPNVPWRAWSFGNVPDKYWDDSDNRSAYMKFLAERLGITKPEEWYNVTARQFRNNDGAGLLLHFRNSPVLAIVDHMPEYSWVPEQFVKGKKTQKRLYSLVCRLFCPENEEIKLTIYDVEFDHKHENLLFADSGRPMEIDVYVPAIELAFEYQGEQHYLPIECWGGEEALRKLQARDQEKLGRCHRANITLIRIPYTWTGEASEFMQYLREGLRVRDEARRRAAQGVPRVLIRPKRPTEAQGRMEGGSSESPGGTNPL
jgi:hypothetical protein